MKSKHNIMDYLPHAIFVVLVIMVYNLVKKNAANFITLPKRSVSLYKRNSDLYEKYVAGLKKKLQNDSLAKKKEISVNYKRPAREFMDLYK
jgi:hypothetical protein